MILFLSALATASPSAEDTAYAVLRARDAVGCGALGEPTPALRDALVALADPATLPPAVPVRAAGCLVELYAEDPEIVEVVLPWMADPARHGLALVVASRLDALPEPAAVALARAAMADGDETRRRRVAARLAKSERESVRAVASEVPAEEVQP